MWTTRLTRDKQYTDDQIFEFSQIQTPDKYGCQVAGHSRSQSPSYQDYSVNFCNLWNVYNGMGPSLPFTFELGDCGFPAEDPPTTCAKYAEAPEIEQI